MYYLCISRILYTHHVLVGVIPHNIAASRPGGRQFGAHRGVFSYHPAMWPVMASCGRFSPPLPRHPSRWQRDSLAAEHRAARQSQMLPTHGIRRIHSFATRCAFCHGTVIPPLSPSFIPSLSKVSSPAPSPPHHTKPLYLPNVITAISILYTAAGFYQRSVHSF